MSTELPALVWDSGKYNFQRKLGNFVQYFQVNLPTNAYGVPLKIVDPTILALHLLDCETTDDVPDSALEAAIVNVDLEEGMPLVEGLPIWERFDGELVEYYKLFKEYREMYYITGTRAISKLAGNHNLEGKNISAVAKVYHWSLRVKAYDAYKKAESMRKRQFEIEKLESRHKQAADIMLERGLEYLENHPEQLNPKVALQMVQVAMKAGRLSVGLNSDKPGSDGGGSGTNISINTNVGTGEATAGIEAPENTAKEPDVSYLQSIVHILDKSGALDKAKQNVIEADFVEVKDGAN